jgi:hypothetical protein
MLAGSPMSDPMGVWQRTQKSPVVELVPLFKAICIDTISGLN